MASLHKATASCLVILIAFTRAASREVAQGPAKSSSTPAAATKTDGPSFEKPVVTIPPFAPIGQLKEYVCAFHLYAHDNNRQMEAHHYCSVINGGKLHQCVLYDNSTAGARLMGIEYLIPSDVFAGLPAEEQQLWHSHKYEVRGVVQFPGLPHLTTLLPFTARMAVRQHEAATVSVFATQPC